jgi:pyruvate/2-oxoglutarate dehydrogenase complex dihydrolipoamide dehydrogenase (E3) component
MPVSKRQCDSRRQPVAHSPAHLHQRRRTRGCAGNARHQRYLLPHEQHNPEAGSDTTSPGHRRRQLRRFGVCTDVPSLWCTGHNREKGSRIISREDEDISSAILGILESENIAVRTQAECISFASRREGIAVGVDCASGEPEVVGTDVLLAVGRRPNTDDLGLDRAGVAVDSRGYIKVDDSLATSVAGIWALGDCNGRGAFTHTAYNDYEIVAANLIDGERRRVSTRVPAYALYIDPPLGRTGMTDTEAQKTGRPILTAQRPMTRVGRAIEKGETRGLMKVVVDAGTKQILGAAILGSGGDEAIHGLLDAINAGLPYDVLQRAVPIHPTVSELIPTLLSDLSPRNSV